MCSKPCALCTPTDASLAGVLGWWSLFNLPRDVLPPVLSSFARALAPGGQLIVATHVGDDDLARTEAYGGVAVRWTTHQWRPERLAALIYPASGPWHAMSSTELHLHDGIATTTIEQIHEEQETNP